MSAPSPSRIVTANVSDTAIVPPSVGMEGVPPIDQPPKGPDAAEASQKGPKTTHFFGCFDCKFGSNSARKMVQHTRATHHRRALSCIPCMATFPSKEKLDQHRAEVDVPAHRYCGRGSCNTIFRTIKLYQAHFLDKHESIPSLVSPEVRRIKKEITREANLLNEERIVGEGEAKKRRKALKAHEKREEAAKHRKELLTMGPVQCHLCSRKFGTPGAYAMHLESGKHHGIQRHHVTQAVHMLDVIPPITLAASIEYQSSVHTESPASSSVSPFTSALSSPRTGDMDGSWIILSDGSTTPASLVPASSISSTILSIESSPVASHTSLTLDPATTYIPNNFVDLSIPHACPLCSKTFRTVAQLSGHMNSPVHDPDAFKCPKPECGRQFSLVSGLIRHLESGTCKLASAGEIFERFALLTARFSKYLAA
ncbi:hypothetical protein FA13DRAFT_1746154 [Coprinellus micaceus]|uniref:C2H2-type domain-containing protein n=1 Tax=Coprinellus micaceus TaxID=71717 RepID=A0A4Y7SAI5_COPMI|nr:hypothetical protein FA13DRAFT_1746154 [Coprinellus micaceus]